MLDSFPSFGFLSLLKNIYFQLRQEQEAVKPTVLISKILLGQRQKAKCLQSYWLLTIVTHLETAHIKIQTLHDFCRFFEKLLDLLSKQQKSIF